MMMKCIAVRSVTYAEKAREILKSNGIPATAKKALAGTDGCGWSVCISEHRLEAALRILRSNGVRMAGEIYDLS